MIKPKKFLDSTVGILEIVSRGNIEYIFIHTASYITVKEVDKIEQMGYWFIEAAKYLRESKKVGGSHRDI